ncbi:uncharacterized protein CDAR_206811 [Caerostris darwini]|uniref:Uncharacterized protein n=1 Tax=Caerostris darwini TaxID=1538125 RepID=A0AAV4UKV2_9ARAC|nr:uncharacterized protein CDAR_206811 [Caerostris darwini]
MIDKLSESFAATSLLAAVYFARLLNTSRLSVSLSFGRTNFAQATSKICAFRFTSEPEIRKPLIQHMGKLQHVNNTKSTSAMDIDPRPTSWNSLCPTYINSRRNKLLQEESEGPVIGSPPPAGPPKVSWDGNYPTDVPNLKPSHNSSEEQASSMDTSELSCRIQNIHLQPQQPIIICETVEDVKVDLNAEGPSSSVSLAVPSVDIANEKKRPPLPAPF